MVVNSVYADQTECTDGSVSLPPPTPPQKKKKKKKKKQKKKKKKKKANCYKV